MVKPGVLPDSVVTQAFMIAVLHIKNDNIASEIIDMLYWILVHVSE